MAKQLKDAAIHELSIVLSRDPETGIEFAPRNPEAMVLSVKGGEKKPFLARVTESLKGYFASQPAVAPQGFPVTENVADDIDGDGDGAEDYNAIVSAVCCLYQDLNQAMCIGDDGARSVAVKCAIDSFLEGLDGIRGDADKAGARHSAADLESLNGIAAAHKDMAAHVAAIGGALEKLGITGGHGPVEGEQGPEQDSGPDNSQVDDDADKAKRTDAAGKDGDEYGDVEYADTANKKYPIDTAEHVRAALSYINMPKNAKFYDADELSKIKSRIETAAKKFGIEVSDDKAAPVEDVQVTEEQMQAAVAKAAADAVTAAVAAVKSELEPQIEAAKAAADSAKAEAAKQAELAATYKAQSEQNAAVIAAVAGQSKGSSALSAAVTAQKSGHSALQSKMLEQLRINPEPTRF